MRVHAAARLVGLGFGLLLLAARASAVPPTVVVLSWDGFRHDAPDRYELPAISRVQREGLQAERLVPVFPSDTFPTHVSMATGTYPDTHGIIENAFRDRSGRRFSYSADASWIQAEPLWVAAERQGRRAAAFFWVGSETDWRGRGASYRRRPFDSSVGEGEKVEQILAWLDLPEAERPALVMSWWHGADSVGHRSGPDHPDVQSALLLQDRALAELLAGFDERQLWSDLTLIIVGDHGMTEVSESVDVGAAVEAAGIEVEAVVSSSATAHVFLTDPSDGAAQRAREALAARLPVDVYRQAEVPPALRVVHPQRTGDLLLIAEPPRTFRVPGFWQRLVLRAASVFGSRTGLHGYAPSHPDMGSTLLAMGRGVPAGRRVGAQRAIDLAPTVAALLEIDPPLHSEGRPIEAIEAELIRARSKSSLQAPAPGSRRTRP